MQTAEPTPDPAPAPTVTPSPEPAATVTPAVTATPAVSSGTAAENVSPVIANGKGTASTIVTLSAETEDPTPATEQTPSEESGGATGGLDPDELNPLTPDGQGTVVDNADDSEGKEFFTITSEDGAVFYLVIDRQKSGDNVYFLNTVTVADLLALAESSGEDVSTVIPSTATPEPDPEPAPSAEPEPEPETKTSGGNMSMLLIALAVVAVGGGAGWYFKIYKPRQQRAADLEEDYPETEPDYGDGAGYDGYDDNPPWDEEGDGEE